MAVHRGGGRRRGTQRTLRPTPGRWGCRSAGRLTEDPAADLSADPIADPFTDPLADAVPLSCSSPALRAPVAVTANAGRAQRSYLGFPLSPRGHGLGQPSPWPRSTEERGGSQQPRLPPAPWGSPRHPQPYGAPLAKP